MPHRFRHIALLLAIPVIAGCASTGGTEQELTVVGRENDVRVEARVLAQNLGPNGKVAIEYTLQNLRSAPIAIADLNPMADYDIDSRTITVHLGAEVPGNEFLPRLLRVNSGDTESYSTGARVSLSAAASAPRMPRPRYLRLKVHILGDVAPFEKLIGIPERAIHDPDLAATLFPEWVTHRETIETNTVPVEWNPNAGVDPVADPSRRRL